MSRSRKKVPIGGVTTARTEKPDKKTWHRRFRRWMKEQLEPIFSQDRRRVSNPWDMSKDGKYWRRDPKGYRK